MIRSRVTLKQLEAFVLVVDTGSFRKAAAALGTTQPNISARISALEASLDVVLMQRDARSVRLTEIGETLVTAARQVIWSGEAFLEVAKRRDLIEERLRLGVTELIACTWLHTFLRAFRDQYPSIKVELQVDLSREIDRCVGAGQLDLAIQTAPFSGNLGEPLAMGSHRYAWLAAPEIARRIGPSPEISVLFDYSIMTHAKHTQSSLELAEFAQANGFSQEQIVHSSSLASCMPMAVDGMGIALLPSLLVREEVATGRLVELSCGWEPNALDVFARYDDRRAPRFVQQASRIAAEVAKDF